MITANPTVFGRWFWQTTASVGIRLRFGAFEFIDPARASTARSIILVGNHISWWDGFFAMELNKRLWKKAFHVMMLEQQLQKRPFMRQTGAFSVKPGSREVVDSIRYTADLLDNPGNLVLIFPQGKIHSQHDRSFHFGTGLEKIISKTPATQLMFFATFLDYGSSPKPTVRIYTREVQPARDLAMQYATFFQEAEKDHIQTVTE